MNSACSLFPSQKTNVETKNQFVMCYDLVCSRFFMLRSNKIENPHRVAYSSLTLIRSYREIILSMQIPLRKRNICKNIFPSIRLCLKGFLLRPKGSVALTGVSTARVPLGEPSFLLHFAILFPKTRFPASCGQVHRGTLVLVHFCFV